MTHTYTTPKPLPKGGTIGFFAPSIRVHDDRLSQAKARLEAAGYKAVIHPQCFASCVFYPQSAGTPQQKAQALHELLKDDNIDAIICARGGNGAIHMLPFVDWALLKAQPKIIMGYSDVTNLADAALSCANVSTVHGPMAREIVGMNDNELGELLAFLNTLQPFSWPATNWLKQGPITGPCIGGNLSVLADLLHTPYAPNLAGAVLMLEDIDEKIHRLDRLLGALALNGTLKNLGGIILGHFTEISDSADSGINFGSNIEEIVLHHTAACNYGILSNIPFGHAQPKPIAYGAQLP
jgi:muramoyltetrapeptide carboxypeptidase